MVNSPDKFPADYGEIIIIVDRDSYTATVTDMVWIKFEHRWRIDLLWPSGDKTKVYSTDYKKYWMKGKDQKILN